MKNTLADFQEWQVAGPNRSVSIKIQTTFSRGTETSIWVYDSNLMAGQYVNDVSEINLEAIKEKEERAKLHELQKKYGN